MAGNTRPFGELFAESTRNGLTRPKAVRGSGVKMVNMGELFSHPRLCNVPMDRVHLSQSEAERLLLEDGDLLFARQSLVLKGAGKCSIFLRDDEPVTFESHVTRVRLDKKKAHPGYYFYYLQSYHGRSAIRSIVEQGAGASGIRGSDLATLEVLWRPLSEQRIIAHILGTLDDKIELNRRMNQTLEEMARALFKSWFVYFDPVRTKMEGRDPGLPQHLADLFPDRLVDSELGPIPEGWEVGAVENLAEVSSGKRPGVRYAEASDLAQVPLWGGNGPMAFVPEPLVEYPILLTGRVGTLGSIFRITSPCWPSDNTLIFKVKDKRTFEFLFFQLKRIDFTSLNRGSTQPLVTQTNLKAQIILLPPENVLERFHTFTKTSYARLDKSESESCTLAALRDTLLPRLVSGELRADVDEETV